MDEVLNPGQAAAPAREFETPGAFHVVAHIALFAGFGGVLALVSGMKEVYDDPGFLAGGLRGLLGAVMDLTGFFVSIHTPLWALAVAGLVVDLAVWRTLRRSGRLLEAHLWMWLVPVAVILVSGIVLVSVFLPLVFDIQSR